MGKASPATRLRGAMTRPRAGDGDGGTPPFPPVTGSPALGCPWRAPGCPLRGPAVIFSSGIEINQPRKKKINQPRSARSSVLVVTEWPKIKNESVIYACEQAGRSCVFSTC